MVPLTPLARALAFTFMALSMFSIGLGTEPGGMWASLRHGRRLARILAANLVLVPAAGLIVARTLAPEPAVATALLLLACTPGGPYALNYAPYVKGGVELAGGSAVLLTFLSFLVSPLLLRVVLPGDVAVVVPYGRLSVLFTALFVAPALSGMAFRAWRRELAPRLSVPCIAMAVVAATAAGWLVAAEQKQALHALGPRALAAMLAMVLLSMAAGWLAGRGEGVLRPVFVIATGIRNVAVCLLIAIHTFPDPRVFTALVAYGALMVFPNMAVYYVQLARRVVPGLRERAREETERLRRRDDGGTRRGGAAPSSAGVEGAAPRAPGEEGGVP